QLSAEGRNVGRRDARAIGRLQLELQNGSLRNQNGVERGVAFVQVEGDAVRLAGGDAGLRVNHDLIARDAAQDLDKVFLEPEDVLRIHRSSYQHVAAGVARDRAQLPDIDVLREAESHRVYLDIDV